MSEVPADKPEVVVESREITLEDAVAAAQAIRGVASDLNGRREPLTADSKDKQFVYSVTGSTSAEGPYGESVYRTYTIAATKREKSEEPTPVTQRDSYGFGGLIGAKPIYPSYAQGPDAMTFTVTQREDRGSESPLGGFGSGYGSKDDLVLTVSLNGERVGRIACDQSECTGSGADLVQLKTRDLVLGVIKPALDKEAQAEARKREEAQKASATKAQEPVKKAKDF